MIASPGSCEALVEFRVWSILLIEAYNRAAQLSNREKAQPEDGGLALSGRNLSVYDR
jgi:hypothetical protein